MNRYLLLSMAFFLAGCPGPGDRFTPRTATTVVLKGSSVCALSIMKPGEKMVSAEIFSTGEGKRFELFPEKPRYIAAGDCLPMFGTPFRAGEKYALYWNIVPLKGDAYLISTKFTLSTDSTGHLSLTDDSTR